MLKNGRRYELYTILAGAELVKATLPNLTKRSVTANRIFYKVKDCGKLAKNWEIFERKSARKIGKILGNFCGGKTSQI